MKYAHAYLTTSLPLSFLKTETRGRTVNDTGNTYVTVAVTIKFVLQTLLKTVEGFLNEPNVTLFGSGHRTEAHH